MVSLINFKTVSEELQCQFREQQQAQESQRLPQIERITTDQKAPDASSEQPAEQGRSAGQFLAQVIHHNGQRARKLSIQTQLQASLLPASEQQHQRLSTGKQVALPGPVVPAGQPQPQQPSTGFPGDITSPAPNFAVSWRDLRFVIEPKWHQNMGNKTNQPASRVVLDQLDGTFRSGELTAILGPSGAGKTTLLDCLTGHRKSGLSGSIRISACSASTKVAHGKCYPQFGLPANVAGCHGRLSNQTGVYAIKSIGNNSEQTAANSKHLNTLIGINKDSLVGGQAGCLNNCTVSNSSSLADCDFDGYEGSRVSATSRDNLKVSIIPQNDHLMGHLTVYETLNYASKMKNCFLANFDHKLNIRRVAMQLGLMSCLATRVNKLSGGQYKRVSIAQELLSSPDILILDEPTSGLDAMTCFQTVQVLKELTEDRRFSGQNQIAVILTIHQPNSDVFQQFNHVYVVAQGGKCIYEGAPGSIETVINRIGIRLPNSYYNPATIIVEIAAGKFGADAIFKLNSIQKKQYEIGLADEQNSPGDSAVDCPSSSSNDEEDGSAKAISANEQLAGSRRNQDENRGRPSSEINNNLNQAKPSLAVQVANQVVQSASQGLVNKGFALESEDECSDMNGTANANNNIIFINQTSPSASKAAEDSKDVIVVVSHQATKQAKNGADSDSIDKARMVNMGNLIGDNTGVDLNIAVGQPDNENRRKRRRRARKRSGDLVSGQQANNMAMACRGSKYGAGGGSDGGGEGGPGSGGSGPGQRREKRLKLNSLKADQRFPFLRHTYLHFHRSWLSIVRDPLLCSMQLALHILVPLMVSLVYGTNVGKPNACPRAGPVDIMAYALEPSDKVLQQQEDFRTTLENIGYIFFKLYGIIFAAMTVTVLTFPLDMHVLVKEFRNGWYGLSSYFLGRTLADIPFQLTLPLLAMSLSYYATGQPYSYMQWRFLSITAILILSSLIAQSQGLLFGAILMDRMKAAVFVAPAATTPIILFAGFLVRTQSIPRYLRPLSNLSYLRYAIEACLISRYGFNQCDCDPAMFNKSVPELPPIARSMIDYWLGSFKTQSSSAHGDSLQLDGSSYASTENSTTSLVDSLIAETTTTTLAPSSNQDLFGKLIDSLSKANSFGRNITSCEQVVPYPMIDYDLKDSQLFNCFAILIFMLISTRLLTFFIVCFKVKRKV